jgi:hypothetical protein
MTEDERKVEITDLQSHFQELNNAAYEKNADLSQERGRQFEKLVREVFKAWGMLVRGSYHTGDNKSEQIDGVLQFEGRYALLEAKWEKANLAASELFSFLGKVEGKFTGTIGVFVSRNELTSNFLTALRAGRRQCIIVIHGQDVDDLFDPEFDLEGYLEMHVLHVCMDNLCHLSTEKFKSKVKAAEAKRKAAAVGGDAVEAKIKECLREEAAKNIVNEFAEAFTNTQRVNAVQRIVNNYADIAASPSGEDAWRGENLQAFLKELIERLPDNFTVADGTFFVEKLSKDYQSPYYRRMVEYFAPRYQYLPADEKSKCEERLRRQWDKVIDDWMSENRMAESTRPLWDYLGEETKKHLIGYFVEFVLSNRGTRHEQYRLADFVLEKAESMPAAKKLLKKHARAAAKPWLDEGYTDEVGLAKTVKSVISALRSMRKYIPDFEATVKSAVEKAAEAHADTSTP